MRILYLVESYYPSSGGMQEVVKQLSERLVERGHHVTVATAFDRNRLDNIHNGVEIKSFKIKGNNVRGIECQNSDDTNFINFVLNSEFDIVTVFAAQQWSCDLILPYLNKLKSKNIFVPTGFSALYDIHYKSYFENMAQIMPNFDHCIFLSYNYRDINFAKSIGINKYSIIPNGADEREFFANEKSNIRNQLGIKENAFVILNVGSHTNVKGHDEAISTYVRSDVSNSVLIINGNTYSKWCYLKCWIKAHLINLLTSKRVKLLNSPRTQLIELYKTSNLFFFPSNIECSPIVLYEACAAKLPFLSSDVGNAREIAEWTRGGLILDTILDSKGYATINSKSAAKILTKVCSDRILLNNLSIQGYAQWKDKFTWDKISRQYEELYEELLLKK